jgi:hypothetical protein
MNICKVLCISLQLISQIDIYYKLLERGTECLCMMLYASSRMHIHFPSCYTPSVPHPAFNQPCSLPLMICRDVYWSPSVISLLVSPVGSKPPCPSLQVVLELEVQSSLLKPSAYLASAADCASMFLTILPEKFNNVDCPQQV